MPQPEAAEPSNPASCANCERLAAQLATLHAAHERLIALAQTIADLGTCELEPDKCYQDSGPYCGAHPHWLDDEVVEARAILAVLAPPLKPSVTGSSKTVREGDL